MTTTTETTTAETLGDLRAAVRGFCETTVPEAEVRRIADTPSGFDAGLWERLSGELGLTGEFWRLP